MIMVLRRWFVPEERLAEFAEIWRTDIMPSIGRYPACLRVEMYKSSIRHHWVSSVLWADELSRASAIQKLRTQYDQFAEYERFEPEVLTLVSEISNV